MSIERLIDCRSDMTGGDLIFMPALVQVFGMNQGTIKGITFEKNGGEFGILHIEGETAKTGEAMHFDVDMGISESGPTLCLEIGPGFFIVAYPRGGPMQGGLIIMVCKAK